MAKPKLELTKKLAVYERKGEPIQERTVFKASIQEFMHKTKWEPYGWLPLYDDMIEKDILKLFRIYKKSRLEYLRKCGIKKRKYIVKNEDRNLVWSEMAVKYEDKPDFIKIASEWANQNTLSTIRLYLEYLWRKPENANIKGLKEDIYQARQKGETVSDYCNQALLRIDVKVIKQDLEEFTRFTLPNIISSAVRRFRKQ